MRPSLRATFGNLASRDFLVTVDRQLTADAAWQSETFDISSSADNRGGIYIRWGYQVAEKMPKAGPGWNIDDVVLEGRAGSSRVILTVSPTDLSWSSVPAAIGYDVVRGNIHTLQQTGGDFSAATDLCLGDDHAGTSMSYADNPAAGLGFWFLVRAVDSTGPLTYQPLDGSGSQVGMRDAEIDASGASCP